jgi:hypothetical protein
MTVTLQDVAERVYNMDWPGVGRIAKTRDPETPATWRLVTGPGTDRALTAEEGAALRSLLEARRVECQALKDAAAASGRQRELLLTDDRLVQALDILADAAASLAAKAAALGQPLGPQLQNRIIGLRSSIDQVKGA